MLGLDFGIHPELGDKRILKPGAWLPLRSLGWILFMVFAIALAFGPGMEALLHSLPKLPAYQFAARAVGALSVLCAYFILVRLGEGRVPSELALAVAPKELISGLATGLSMFAIVMAILTASGLYSIEYHGAASPWHGAGLAIESGVLEEVIVRGVILRVVWRAAGPIPAFILSSLLFGVGHIFNPGANIFTTLCLAIEAGVMLGSLYALTGRLWVSIGVHAGWNFTQGFIFGTAVSGGDFGESILRSTARTDVPSWLTGGAFGPEASLPALLVCTFVGVIALLSARLNGRFACTRTISLNTGQAAGVFR